MKKIYILLIAVGMTALATQANAQCGKIQSIQGPSQDPCEGTNADFMIVPGPSSQNGTFTWSRMSGNPLPASFISNVDGNATLYQASKNDEDTYICTFYGTNGCSDVALVDLVVKPNPNADYTLTDKCNGSVTLTPVGGDYYLTYDQNGGLTVPLGDTTFTGTGLLLTGGGFRAFKDGCYSDVTINQIWAKPLVITAVPSKWLIKPGQSTTISATANYQIVTSKTRWFKDGVKIVNANGASSITVSDIGLYKVRMEVVQSSGGCVKGKQIRIKERIVNGAREIYIDEIRDTQDDDQDIVSGNETEKDQNQNNLSEKSKLLVWPNPATDQIQVTGYDQDLKIVDVNGRMLQSRQVDTFNGNDKPQPIDVSYLPNGIYLITSGQQSFKFVVSR